MRSWYEIKAQADTADVYLYDEIGGFGIPASQFVSELRALKGKALNVYINSPGGDAFAGIAIYNVLARHDAAVNVTVDGIAASIASVIAQAGTKRTMGKSSALMIHDAWGLAVGNAETMAQMQGELDDLSNSIADIYADKAGGTPETWRAAMKTETWYRAEDAVTAGLADEAVVGYVNAYAGRVFNLSNFTKVPEWVNHTDETQPEPGVKPEPTSDKEEEDMAQDDTAIRQALGLDAEGDIAAAIQALRTRADVAEATLQADAPDKADAAQMRAQLQGAQGELLALKTKHAEDILSLKDTMRKDKAQTMVEAAVQAGHVLPADRDLAYDLAYNNVDAFEQFRSRQRVDLRERGTAGIVDGIEITKDEAAVAASMGVTHEQLVAQKLADKGIKVPS